MTDLSSSLFSLCVRLEVHAIVPVMEYTEGCFAGVLGTLVDDLEMCQVFASPQSTSGLPALSAELQELFETSPKEEVTKHGSSEGSDTSSQQLLCRPNTRLPTSRSGTSRMPCRRWISTKWYEPFILTS